MGSIAKWYEFAELFAFCELHASRVQGWRMSVIRYYDRQGFPIPARDGVEPTLVWAQMRERDDPIVAVDQLPDGSRLSTVWLGLDHGFGGRPLIFETMRFAGETHLVLGTECHASLDFPDPFGELGDMTEQLRYTTEEEALAAHHEIVRRIVIREGH